MSENTRCEAPSQPDWEEMYKHVSLENECLQARVSRLEGEVAKMEAIKRTLYVVFGRGFGNE